MNGNHRHSAVALIALVTTAGGSLARAAFGDDPAPPAMSDPAMGDAKPAAAPAVMKILRDIEAAPLLDALKKAAKTRTSVEALPAIDAIAGTTHPEFETALGRLLGHLSVDVAVRAASSMGERAGPKTGAALWKGWALPINEKRPAARVAILLALAKSGGRLDDKQYKEVEALWTLAASPESMIGVARYFEAQKTDKRPCKAFSIFLDEPKAGSNVADGSNPPAEYWEARWKLWHAVKPATIDALKAITGQVFDTSEDAKAWFRAHKEFGVSSW